jgi:class 3 adenylate cyclase
VDIAAWLHTAEDLRDIGVNFVGHRRKLLVAISALRSGITPDAVASAASAERPKLTVMFCDLVGSTELSVRRDPEDLRDLIGAYHRAVAEVVTRYEGFVARYMGDGILIYFSREMDLNRFRARQVSLFEASQVVVVETVGSSLASGEMVWGRRRVKRQAIGTPDRHRKRTLTGVGAGLSR